MFGYVTVALNGLSKQEQERYRSAYCGLCRRLNEKYGQIGQITLSYDMTFLYLLLNSLYEPNEEVQFHRCCPHMFRKHPEMKSALVDYCADMNIILSYHKAKDDWKDEHKLTARLISAALQKSYHSLSEQYPRQEHEITESLQKITEIEKCQSVSPDAGANATATLLGTVYRYQEDIWSDTLQRIGEGIGRFVYLMDAYEDLYEDIKFKRYNPLLSAKQQDNYEEFVKNSLTLFIAESTEAFETLPLEKDIHILRNILYAGCWSRYEALIRKTEQKSGIAVQSNKR